MEFDLYRWDLLAGARELLLQRLLITREEAGDCPSIAERLDWGSVGGRKQGKTYTATRHAKRRILVRFRAKKPLLVVVNAMVSRDANRK